MTRERLPTSIRASVVTALYADAARLGWQTLAPADRTAAFNRWLEDPNIGGKLERFMTLEQARLWITDGPMKEYSRAMRGQGRFAEFGREGGTSPKDVVRHALGDDASILGAVGSKPLHCVASSADGRHAYVAWGDASNFRHLLWAALRASVAEDLEGHIVVLEPPGTVTPGDVSKHQRALAERCALNLHYLKEIVGHARGGGAP